MWSVGFKVWGLGAESSGPGTIWGMGVCDVVRVSGF